MPLQVARLDRDLRRARPRALDVEEGLLAGQLGHGGVLRAAQERILLWPGLGGSEPGGFRIAARRLHEILPRREDQRIPRMDEPQPIQEIARPGRLASPVNGAHPPMSQHLVKTRLATTLFIRRPYTPQQTTARRNARKRRTRTGDRKQPSRVPA